MATPQVPTRQARPKLSETMTPGATPQRSASAPRSALADASGSMRQQQQAPGLDVGVVYAGIRHHVAEPVLDDRHARPMAHDLRRFPEQDFDMRGVLAGQRREPFRGRRRHRLGRKGVAPLGLGNDLLRDDEDVAGLEPGSGAFEPLRNQFGKVVARLDHRQSGQRNQLQPPRHAPSCSAAGVPVILRPAPSMP